MDTSLAALLRFSKSPDRQANWLAVREVLAPLYHPNMAMRDVLRILIEALEQVVKEPRFCVGQSGQTFSQLALCPLGGIYALGDSTLGPGLKDEFAVEAFVNAMVGYVLGELSIARIDWCRGEIWAQESPGSPQTPSTPHRLGGRHP